MSEYSLKADFNFENLVVSYIYHSFNTNTNNLLYLLKYRSIPEDAKFNATNEEIQELVKMMSGGDGCGCGCDSCGDGCGDDCGCEGGHCH